MKKPNLTLASGSKARQDMLRNAGYIFDVLPADIDEEKIIGEEKNTSSKNVSLILAKEKAKYISCKNKENYVIGSDQILSVDNNIFSKTKNKEEAVERLMFFQGKTHSLFSSVSVFKNGNEVFSFTDGADLTMSDMDRKEIEKYCDIAGNILTSCVGCYALEGVGIRLFDDIKGDYFTILGMPLLPLIKFLDGEGFKL